MQKFWIYPNLAYNLGLNIRFHNEHLKKNIIVNKTYRVNQILKYTFISIATIIVLVSTLFTNRLASNLAIEERKKIEIWAEATQQLIFADEYTDINFLLDIIEGNTTIPVLIIDENSNVIQHRNMKVPASKEDAYFKKKVKKLSAKNEAIVIKLDEDTQQYIIFDESYLLRQLYFFPYVQFGVIIIFLAIVILVFTSTKRAEQNQVWVGLSKETAHQLGTPISSLLAWTELLKLRYSEEKLLEDMERDVNRLKIISERFSKIGSKPDLKPQNINDVIENAVNYIRNRSSEKIIINYHNLIDSDSFAQISQPLFEWVVENVSKNAIDAMNGRGQLDIYLKKKQGNIVIDIQDTGKGIERKYQKAVFSPGFTTKERGWGLGLSLVKRIVEEYHAGKVYVKESEINKGTIFRIVIPADMENQI